jgi:hypothetical protein
MQKKKKWKNISVSLTTQFKFNKFWKNLEFTDKETEPNLSLLVQNVLKWWLLEVKIGNT